MWGFTAILAKSISIHSEEIVFYRSLLASCSIGLWLIYKKKNVRLDKKIVTKALLNGALICLHWLFFFLAGRLSTLSISLIGVATTSFWVSLIEPIIAKRKIRTYEIVLGLMVVLGIYVIFHSESLYWGGLLSALLSAIFAAVFTVINGTTLSKYDGSVVTFFEMTGACLTSMVIFPLYIRFFAHRAIDLALVTFSDVFYLLMMSLLCTSVAYIVLLDIMKKITPFTVTLNSNLEPIYGMTFAILIFGNKEVLNLNFYIGSALVLIPVFLHSYFSITTSRSISNRPTPPPTAGPARSYP